MNDKETRQAYDVNEAVCDIAMTVGFYMGKGRLDLEKLENVDGSRGLVSWIIDKAECFEAANRGREWDGEYIEEIDEYSMECMREAGLLTKKEEVKA
jgi:hypothetical protein